MDDTKFIKDQLILENDYKADALEGRLLTKILLPNQNGNLLNLNRTDTFRLVIYFFSLTGHPNKILPKDWDKIPGANGCTLENCTFRDNYDNLIQLNALPIGVSTQSVQDIKEMTIRLGIQYDILSDLNLKLVNKLSLPTFSIQGKKYIKRLTIILEKNIIKKVFFPIFSINNHIKDVTEWLKKN